MVKNHLVGAIIVLFLSFPVWSETISPSVIATPPQPSWSELTVPQKIILAPLSDEWDSLESYRQKKWLGIAARFPTLSAAEQRRIQAQMKEWRKLTPQERSLARENYRSASLLPADKKQELRQKWEQYSSLPEEEKAKYKSQAGQRPAKPTRILPRASALPGTSPLSELFSARAGRRDSHPLPRTTQTAEE